MKTLKYNKIMPRVAIEKLKLIEEEDLVDLVGRNLEAIRCALIETSYRDEILKLLPQETSSNSLEVAILENYAETMKKLINFSSGDLKKLLLAFIRKIETSNIKSLLRAKKANINLDEAINNTIPIGFLTKDRCREILSKSKTIEDVMEYLFDTEYGDIIQNNMTEIKTANSLLPLELALDQVSYNGISKVIEKFKGLDKKIAKNVIGIEIDSINIKIILRGKAKRIPKEIIKKYLLPSFFIRKNTFLKGLETSDMNDLIVSLMSNNKVANNPFYRNIFSQILEKKYLSIGQIEHELEKASLRVSLRMQKKYLKYYNVSSVLVFLNLKRIEIKNLRCIIVGSKREVESSEVKRLLILKNNN